MASACVNSVGMPPENFLDYGGGKFQKWGWIGPKISFSREISGEEAEGKEQGNNNSSWKRLVGKECDDEEKPDPEVSGDELGDFEFRLEDPIKMLPADELFSNGKLLPLHLTAVRHSVTTAPGSSLSFEARSPEAPKCCPSTDPYMFSPKAPRCASHWKEIIRRRKLHKNFNLNTAEDKKITAAAAVAAASLSSHKTASRNLKQFLHRNSKSSLNTCTDSSLNLPLLKDSDHEPRSISSRFSLSSSSHDHDELHLHRFSLDSEKPCFIYRKPLQTTSNVTKVRASKTTVPQNRRRNPESTAPIHTVAVDSPRMNPSGKIVFHSLERSSSSPSSFNGGPRHKHNGMQRSYSANVRITPVLNVPVCSSLSKSGVFGLPLFQKKETGNSISGRNRGVTVHSKNRS